MKIPIFAHQKQAMPVENIQPETMPKRATPVASIQPGTTSEQAIPSSRVIRQYTLIGVLFGLIFPIASSLILLYENDLPVTLGNLITIQKTNPLLWIIDTAPIFLGFFAFIIGKNHAQALLANKELENSLFERSRLVNQLEVFNASLEEEVQKRVIQIQTASQVAQEANSIRDLDQLLKSTTSLISERFGYYHVGIFINDSKGLYTVLEATNSAGGRRMLAREHRLKIGQVGIVGDVAAKGAPRIALDVSKEGIYYNNPDLSETHSEIALPIKTGKGIIGVLDIQSIESGAFDQNDATSLQIIADSLGSAIENSRLFKETQDNLEEIRSLHHNYLKHAWSETIRTKSNLEYTYGSADQASSASKTLESPIRLRDQVIGQLVIEAEPNSPAEATEWTPDQVALVEAITDQAAQALENARLLSESQQRAAREQLTGEVTARMRASLDVDTVLKTAIEEIYRGLELDDLVIQISPALEDEK